MFCTSCVFNPLHERRLSLLVPAGRRGNSFKKKRIKNHNILRIFLFSLRYYFTGDALLYVGNTGLINGITELR